MCVTVINVGYGDAILFQLKNGYTALLDGCLLYTSDAADE